MIVVLLKVLGWLLVVLLAVLALCLVVPVRLEAELKYDRFSLKAKVLFVTVRLWPRTPHGKRHKAAHEPQHLARPEQGRQAREAAAPTLPESEAQAAGRSDKEQAGGMEETHQEDAANGSISSLLRGVRWADVTRILSTAGGLMRLVFRVIRVRDVQLVLPVYREDMAELAIQYGRVQAWLGSVFAALQNFLDFQLKQVDIIPDFAAKNKYRRYFYCKIMATPFIIITAAVYMLRRLKQSHRN